MTYQVIARKWRPQTFEEVTGQEPITRTLRGAIEHDRLHHAYVFSGARGVGKTTTARLLAKALNCHKSDRPTATPCRTTDADQCPSCREVAEGRSIDVLEIDAASNTGVENVRDTIISTINIRPARDRYKVFIIDEVHMLSVPAFNALLKTLEEPPSRVVFIMATTNSHKIPDTILSRSQQFEFRTIAALKIADRLRLIADAEGLNVDAAALREIARAGEGSMRDAQSAFDQVISFSGEHITAADVEAALGIAGAELLARVMRAVAEAAPRDALAVVDDLVMRGHDLRNFCRDLLGHLRDLLVVKVAGEAAEFTDAEAAERQGLAQAAEAFSESDLVRCFHSLSQTEQTLREGAHPRYQLEIGLVKLIELRRLAPLDTILERLHALEASLNGGNAPRAGTTFPPSTGGGFGGANSSGGAPRGGYAGGGTSTGGRRGLTPATDGRDSSSPAAAPGTNGDTTNAGQRSTGHFTASANSDVDALADAPFVVDAAPSNEAVPINSEADVIAYADDASAPPVLKLVPPPGPPPRPAMVSSAAAPPATASATPDSLCERLKNALEARRKPFLAIALEGARRVEVEGDELCVEFAPEAKHLRDNLAKPDAQRLLRELACQLLEREVGVRVFLTERHETDATPPVVVAQDSTRDEQQRLHQLAEQDPAVQQLLRSLQGEIVEVCRLEPGEQAGKA